MMTKLLTLLVMIGLAAGYFAQTSYPSNTWKQIRKKGLVGYIDPEGNVMLEPQFENASDFSCGRAFVWSYPGREEDMKGMKLGEKYESYERFGFNGNSRTGIIDSTGKYIVEPKVNFRWRSMYCDNFARVEIDRYVWTIDLDGNIAKKNNSTTQADLDVLNIFDHYEKGMPVRKIYVNPFRELKIGPVDRATMFSDGLAAVQVHQRWGYVNKSGRFVISPQYKKAGSFVDGLARVSYTINRLGDERTVSAIIDTLGNIQFESYHEYLGDPQCERVLFSTITRKAGEEKTTTRYGFLDTKGETVVEAHYEEARSFYEGLAAVKIKGKFGFINKDGELVIPAIYDRVGRFSRGTAYVFKRKKTGIINKEGELIWGMKR